MACLEKLVWVSTGLLSIPRVQQMYICEGKSMLTGPLRRQM